MGNLIAIKESRFYWGRENGIFGPPPFFLIGKNLFLYTEKECLERISKSIFFSKVFHFFEKLLIKVNH